MPGNTSTQEMNKRNTMLKRSYHARLSVWHVVLMVIILAVSLPVIAKPCSSPINQFPQLSNESQPTLTFGWQKIPDDMQPLQQKGHKSTNFSYQ